MEISKETILKLMELSDFNKMESSKDMQYALEEISHLLTEEFSELSTEYILSNL